jgi:hypothetical protein
VCRLMNNVVIEVMKADSRSAASDTFISGYFSLLRLLVRLAADYPEVQHLADKDWAEFMASSDNRNKDKCPNIGDILPLLCISSRFSWSDVAGAYQESLTNAMFAGTFRIIPNLPTFIQATTASPSRFLQLQSAAAWPASRPSSPLSANLNLPSRLPTAAFPRPSLLQSKTRTVLQMLWHRGASTTPSWVCRRLPTCTMRWCTPWARASGLGITATGPGDTTRGLGEGEAVEEGGGVGRLTEEVVTGAGAAAFDSCWD